MKLFRPSCIICGFRKFTVYSSVEHVVPSAAVVQRLAGSTVAHKPLTFLCCCVLQDATAHHYPAHLLAQAHLAGSHWGQHPQLTGSIAADTAALYDTSSQMQHQQQLAGLPLHPAAALPGLSGGLGPLQSCLPLRPAAPGLSSLDANNRSGSSGSLGPGGVRKPRYNNSISLNKQIMNTHSARELHAIVRAKGAGFDFFNISSAIARVPKLVGPAGGVQVGCWCSCCRAHASWEMC
jgi:hypothetical protein